MAGDPTLYIPRSPLSTGRASLFTPGYTPIPALRRVTEDHNPRALESEGNYRVAERNTVLA